MGHMEQDLLLDIMAALEIRVRGVRQVEVWLVLAHLDLAECPKDFKGGGPALIQE